MAEFIMANSAEAYGAAALLFKEYAQWLNIDLSFQQFEKELSDIKSMYSLPYGGIFLCREKDEYVGCIAVRPLENNIAELKRMYVKPAFQGRGIGKELLEKALELAVACGYRKVRLDTLNTMVPAMQLYTKNGFYTIPAYYYNPEKTAVYFEKEL